MKAFYSILAFSILLVVPAFAQIDPTPDGIGIYADLGGLSNRVKVEPNTPLEVYLLLTNPSSDLAYGGWECGVIAPDNAEIWGFNFPIPGAVAIIKENNFVVGFPDFFPLQTVNLLMTFIITPLDGRCAYFYVTGNHGWGDEDAVPRYLVEGDELVEMYPYSEDVAGPSFAINEAELATDSVSFDQVKALFR